MELYIANVLSRKVLIIDDEIDFCQLLKAFFTRKNFQVFICHTLREGLKQLDKVLPDILFLDNNLPDGLGWDHAPLITEKYPNLLLILISAYHPNLPHIKITSNLKLLEKPISMRQLEASLAIPNE